MATIDSNLYPPIFKQSYVPAFVYNGKCRIYFAISAYNQVSELHPTKPVQIMVQNQRTNSYALSDTKYPSGIMLTTLEKDSARAGQDKYYIEIAATDIKNGFTLNEYYKVQIRFTGAKASTPPSQSSGIDSWLSTNLQHFSQWSTVVLIYGISAPQLTLTGLQLNKRVTFTSLDVPIVGKVTFKDEADREKLKSYHIYLYDTTSGQLLQDSGTIYVNKYDTDNEINYTLSYNLQVQVSYTLKVNIETTNLYSFTEPMNYRFIISEEEETPLDIGLEYESNNDSGFIKITLQNNYLIKNKKRRYFLSNNNTLLTGQSLYLAITPQDEDSSESAIYVPNEDLTTQSEAEEEQDPATEPEEEKDKTLASFKSAIYVPDDLDQDDEDDDNTLVLYNREDMNNDMSKGTSFIFERASNRTNFKRWEKIDIVTIEQDLVTNLIWFDYTIEPGVWYIYKITRISSTGVHSGYLKIETPTMIVPEDIFLQANGEQLRIRFDPQVDGIKQNISEALTETIGSKYPYIRRNGNVNYKSFALSGTITSFMNIKDNLLDASKTDLYGQSKDLYDQYNKDNNISPYRDYIYERQFRNKVIDFLYENNVKLYRSLTEGNILVKLMDISFTPNQTLGRLIYSFSCTAYEIGECNIDNYQRYKIVKGRYRYIK